MARCADWKVLDGQSWGEGAAGLYLHSQAAKTAARAATRLGNVGPGVPQGVGDRHGRRVPQYAELPVSRPNAPVSDEREMGFWALAKAGKAAHVPTQYLNGYKIFAGTLTSRNKSGGTKKIARPFVLACARSLHSLLPEPQHRSIQGRALLDPALGRLCGHNNKH